MLLNSDPTTSATVAEVETSPAPRPANPPGRRVWQWEQLTIPLLALIVLLGGYFRFTGLNWDALQHLHPDERFLTILATRLETPPNLTTYLSTSRSPLNPYNVGETTYVYGNFPMTVTRYVAEWAQGVCETGWLDCLYNYVAYNGIHLVGRALSAGLDLIAIILTFLIGRRLYDWRVGLTGALLLAAAVMPIQQAHFFTTDNWAASLTTLTLYMAVRASQAGNRYSWWALFGVGLGLATASRINMAPLAVMAVVAAGVWLNRQAGGWRNWLLPAARAPVSQALTGLVIAGVVSLVVFRLAMPYAFADQETLAAAGAEAGGVFGLLQRVVGFNPAWVADMAEIQRLQQPDAMFPPALQWTSRPAVLFPLINIVLYGLGVAAGLAAWGGLAWATGRIARGRPDWSAHLIPVFWSGFYFLFMGTRWVKSIRYFLPIYPMLALLAAWALWQLWREAEGHPWRRRAAGALGVGVVLFTLLWANSFIQIYRQPLTRVTASDWIYHNIPSGATLLYTPLSPEAEPVVQTWQLPLKEHRFAPTGVPLTLRLILPVGGQLNGVRFNYLSSESSEGADWNVALHTEEGDMLAQTTTHVPADSVRRAHHVTMDQVALEAGRVYMLIITPTAGGPVTAGTSVIANEHWDDSLPVRLDGRDPFSQYYTGVRDEVLGFDGQIPITHPDEASKRLGFYRWLDQADVIVLSSQRALWSIPRLPLTYPLTIRYYEALFNGELGFELAAQFHADWRLGPLFISDTTGQVGWGQAPAVGWPPPGMLAAEETFSVYDHPPVWIFVKSPDYSPDAVFRTLSSVDLTQQMTMNPGQATAAPHGLLLKPETWAVQRANGSFNEVVNLDSLLNRYPALAAGVWWLAATALGWLAFPLTWRMLAGLPSRGYALARILALLIVSYMGWLLASLHLLPNSRETWLLMVGLLAGLNVVLLVQRPAEVRAWVRHNRRLIALVEILGLLLFLVGIGLRLGNPDVWDVIWGGEKPMDLAYFTAVLKSSTFPPYDPWYAGGFINYYYYGFVYVGVLTRLLGLLPATAYNLILPMLYSFTGLGAFTIAYDLVAYRRTTGVAWNRRAAAAGLTAAILCIGLGNLGQGKVIRDALRQTGTPGQTGVTPVDNVLQTVDGALKALSGQPLAIYTGDWFWKASRAVGAVEGEAEPITEFPFFTFLYGDLHAHMIALPLTLLALGWVVNLALWPSAGREMESLQRIDSHPQMRTPQRNSRPGMGTPLGLWLVGALVVGVLYPTNSWDWPTYVVLAALGIGLYQFRRHGDLTLPMLSQTLLTAGGVALLSVALFYPFWSSFGRGYSTLQIWEGSTTSLGSYLRVYGLFLFVVVTYLARETRAWVASWRVETLERLEPVAWHLLAAAAGYVALVLALTVRGYPVAAPVLLLVGAAGILGFRPSLSVERRVVLGLIACALMLTLIVEIVVLAGDISRMNTVFKFYIQVWVLLSVAGGAALAWVWPALSQWGARRRRVWLAGLTALTALAALYPLLATPAKWQVRMSQEAPHTLNGMAFMATTTYNERNQTISLAPDYAAIQWLQANVPGSPVIAEAHSDNPYRSIGGRVAMYTGLPTIIGWDWHQRQQRAVLPDSRVPQRIQAVTELYNTPDPEAARAILARYDVSYVYVGALERLYYTSEGLAKFEEMAQAGELARVYQQDTVTIYAVTARR